MKRFSGILLALIMAVSMIPAAAFAESAASAEAFADSPSDPGQTAWYDSIPDMLAAGNYEEGVVIAGIDMSRARNTGDPGSALETKKLRSGTEELISVDPEAALAEDEFSSWLQEHKSRLAEQNDGICITSISHNGMTTARILKLLASDESVVFAEPNYTATMESQESADSAGADSAASEAGDAAGLRDVSSLQWSSAENTSLHIANKTKDVSVKVPGWPDGSNMDHEIIVAVMDIPVDFSNPDLADRAYTFSPELKAKLGCDDHGINATWDSETGGRLDYREGADHGSHVAGIIGASWDGKGISGVASNVRIISVQNSTVGMTSVIDSLKGMNFIKEAAESGVDIRIVNNSWCVDQSSKAIDAAVTELGRHGIINVFAAGNSSEDLNVATGSNGMMANNPYAIIVASTDPAGELADYSCYGKGVVDLGAPGAGILSCLQTDSAQYIPVLTKNNKVYEDFENGDAGEHSVKVCQVEYCTDSEGRVQIDPADEVGGTEGTVVSGSSEMGFEGSNLLKVSIDRSKLGGYNGSTCALKIDFGDVSGAGVTAGDLLGFAYGSKNEIEPLRTSDTSSGSAPEVSFFAMSDNNCFNTHSYQLSKGINTEDLSIIFEFNAEGAEEIYLDAFGIGNEKVPYGFMSGTSMASPAVAGAAAVIASRHYDELSPGDPASAEKLANLVRSSVRPLASLKDMTNTGGIIDLTADGEAAEPADQPGPDITDAAVSGSNVTLTGTGFGSSAGTVTAGKFVAGSSADMGSAVTSWTDTCVSFTLAEEFEGILEAELTAANGKQDRIVRFISKSSNVFEKDHHFGSATGETFEYNFEPEQMGDLETTGILVAGGSKLYYMPQIDQVETNPSFRYLYCFDPDKDSWTACPSYPSWIKNASGAWVRGKLYVKGASVEVDDSGSIPYYDGGSYEPAAASVYSYTPGDSSWKKCSAKGVADELTLFAAGSRLMLAGMTDDELWAAKDGKYPSVRDYDPAKGAGKPLGYSPCTDRNLKAVYAGGHIYLCDYNIVHKICVLDENLSATEDDYIELPEFYFGSASDRRRSEENHLNSNDFSLTAYGDTLILTGGAAMDGTTDTFLLKAGERKFRPYERRVSDAKVIMPCAAVLDSRLYVIGASDYEHDRRVFRSSLISSLKPERPVSIKGAKVVLKEKSLTYNGKVRKPYIKTIGGKLLTEGVDYTVKYSKSSPENVGTYTVTIKGKSNYTGTTRIKYKIRPRGTGIKSLKRSGKAVAVTWSRQSKKMSKSRITGYQIQLATDKNFTENKRTVTVKGYKKTSVKVTKLKAKKKYYVRIRTYKKQKSGKYYSKWSKVKTVRTR